MINSVIKLILMLLIIFTPVAFGSMELWAFSIMELGILLIIILWATQSVFFTLRSPSVAGAKDVRIPHSAFVMVLLSLFLLLILFQFLPLPPEILKTISPKTYALRQALSISNFELSASSSSGPSALSFPLSFLPFLTQIEFFKWLTLIGLFVFLLRWSSLGESDRTVKQLIVVVMIVGVLESLYGMFEFFSGHLHILNLDGSALISSVTGTFINRNYLAGYLLMLIPLSIGFLFSRGATQIGRSRGWRERLLSLDGKTLLIGFGVIVMILGLLFTASRMGILSLLLSFSLISFLFRNLEKGKRYSKTVVLIFGLALIWATWIGLDAVISRFFASTDDFKFRWAMWASTFQILKDFPLFGSGLGTFACIFPMYRSLHVQGLATHAENDLLQLASEAGLIGVGLLLIVFFYLFWRIILGFRSLSHGEPERYIGMGGLVGILALMLHSLVERNIQVPSNAFLYTMLWAIVLKVSIRNPIIQRRDTK